MSDLRIQLFPIGTRASSVTFTSADGSLAHALASSTTPGWGVDDSAAGSAAFSPVGVDCPSNPNVACHAQLGGDAWAGTGEVDASAFAGDAFGAQVDASAFLAGGRNYATFELSADTVMVITAVSDLYASSSGNDYASSTAYLNVSGSEGDNSQSSSANALVLAGGPFGGHAIRHALLTVSFVNALGHSIDGSLFGAIDATAASSVPEPANAWLLLAGFLALAVRRRHP